MKHPHLIEPQWPRPSSVRALLTTRKGGCSLAPYDGFNLAGHVGDDPTAVAANRALLRNALPAEPLWLEQVHGTAVAEVGVAGQLPCADAAVARRPGEVCAVLTADCLPVLLCDEQGSVVAAAHAGWRGLASGILEATIERMACSPAQLLAWLGPAIGPQNFEVGEEVRAAFIAHDEAAAAAFLPGARTGKWMADLFLLARQRLQQLGVKRISGGGVCTVANPASFYSYRRDGRTGRFATLIWLQEEV